MDRSSKHCASPVCSFNDLFISCEGVCSQRFHAVCVGLSIADVVAISASRNLFWLCDACRDHLRTGRATVAQIGGASGKENCCASSSCMFLDEFVQCDGQCQKKFHASCVHLGKLDLLVIVSSVNILWFCDSCKKQVLPPVRDEPVEEPAELKEEQKEDSYVVSSLETKFENVIEKLTRLSEHLENGSSQNSSPTSAEKSGAENSVLKCSEKDPVIEATKSNDASQLKHCDGDYPMKEVDNDTVDKSLKDNIETQEKDVENGQNEQDPGSSKEKGICSDNDFPMTDKETDQKNDTTKNVQVFAFGSGAKSVTSGNFSFSKPNELSHQFQKNLAEQVIKKPMQKPMKHENDENNNPPEPKKPLLVPTPTPTAIVKQENATFSLWIRFSDPKMSEGTARRLIRDTLGMTGVDPISVRNVIPFHVECPIYAAFKVDMEARWKAAALLSATWQSTTGYMQHREWLR